MRTLLDTRRLLVIIVLLGLFAMAMRPVTDPDLWWHLKTGELISSTHHVIRTDPFSFTRQGQRWINHEWLSDWLIFTAYRHLGIFGLDAIFAAALMAALFIVFLRSPGNRFAAALFTIWGAIASAPSWGVRPQMISLLLASIFLWVVERAEHQPGALCWLAPLTLLWVNLHAGYALGIALVVLQVAGLVLEVALGRRSWSESSQTVSRAMIVLVICCAVVPMNPNGTALYWYPMTTLRSHAMQSYIAEWFSPNFHEAKSLPFLAMLLAVFICMAVSPRRIRIPSLLLLLATTWSALQSTRHIPIFVLVAVPILAELVQFRLASPAMQKSRSSPRSLQILNYVVLLTFLGFTFVRVRSVEQSQPRVEAKAFPAAAVQFIKDHRVPGPLLNHYNWGGYVIWRLYPEYRVFIDGRADLYGDRFMDDFADLYYVKKSDWFGPLDNWQIQTVLMPPDAPLVEGLRLRGGWKEEYRDEQAVLLVRSSTSILAAGP